MLQTNTSLLKVDLSCNEFGDKVGDNLANAIKASLSLIYHQQFCQTEHFIFNQEQLNT